MSNLLSEQARKRISSEYRSRFIFAGSFLSVGAALFTALILSPSFGVLLFTRPAAAEQASQALQSNNEAADIARAQMLVGQLSPIVSASSSISTAIRKSLENRPGGVRIDSIAYEKGITQTISLGGEGDSREVLDKYRTKLQTEPMFSTVKLPVGDLVSFRGGRFTITLNGKF